MLRALFLAQSPVGSRSACSDAKRQTRSTRVSPVLVGCSCRLSGGFLRVAGRSEESARWSDMGAVRYGRWIRFRNDLVASDSRYETMRYRSRQFGSSAVGV